MAKHKILQKIGLTALCNHIKGINTTTSQLTYSVVQISEALQNLSAEVEEILNDLEDEIQDLRNDIIFGVVVAPLAMQDRTIIATRDGVEIDAVRIF